MDLNINNYFDRIFVLNLDKRQDRRKAMEKKLFQAGITNYTFFKAIDGTQEPAYSHYLNKIKINNFFESPGAFGILCSIINLLCFAKNKGYKKILILEDDAIFHQNFYKLFSERIKNINNNWKLLYLGTMMERIILEQSCIYNNGFLETSRSIAGAFAVGINLSIFDELIYLIKTTNKPWDIGPLSDINKKYMKNNKNEVIILYPYLVIAQTNDSNLRESVSLNSSASKYGWDLFNFNL